ncbi:hypothetical protein ZWY2020_032896 [Hordeum vulgare]|nr:hypothetical protein ZWY2020_032896 [Hordeum vulgare]
MLRRRLWAILTRHQGARGLIFLLWVPSSQYSKVPWVLRCSPDSPPPEGDQHLNRTGASGALKAMVCDMFRPLVRNISDIRSLRTVFDLEDYQVGMMFGVFSWLRRVLPAVEGCSFHLC